MKNKIKNIPCPYCGKHAVLRPGHYVYGENATVKFLYVCTDFPACDSYVHAHEHDLKPMGVPANGSLRHKRIQAHKLLNRIIRARIFTREQAYAWMTDKFCLNRKQAHIGLFSDFMCDQLISACTSLLQNNRIAL